jgi:hypothetical protein
MSADKMSAGKMSIHKMLIHKILSEKILACNMSIDNICHSIISLLNLAATTGRSFNPT